MSLLKYFCSWVTLITWAASCMQALKLIRLICSSSQIRYSEGLALEVVLKGVVSLQWSPDRIPGGLGVWAALLMVDRVTLKRQFTSLAHHYSFLFLEVAPCGPGTVVPVETTSNKTHGRPHGFCGKWARPRDWGSDAVWGMAKGALEDLISIGLPSLMKLCDNFKSFLLLG